MANCKICGAELEKIETDDKSWFECPNCGIPASGDVREDAWVADDTDEEGDDDDDES
jgi:ribosomal protein L37E